MPCSPPDRSLRKARSEIGADETRLLAWHRSSRVLPRPVGTRPPRCPAEVTYRFQRSVEGIGRRFGEDNLPALKPVRDLLRAVDVDRGSEAQPLCQWLTSVTEDMATCMRLHAAGWKSAYHHETLALGIAPEDLPTMLTQRLRWAQGTMQVMFRENPLFKKGLSFVQHNVRGHHVELSVWLHCSGLPRRSYDLPAVRVIPVHAYSASLFYG